MRNRIEIVDAPRSGYMLAYYRKKIVFRSYEETEDPQQLVYGAEEETGELLELHLFDEKKSFAR
ncbi:MAG: hypothetical protein LUE31_06615 [Lachnospiraceae bacterium]|nr:hypothetical protein [Lachnospiraceae bacterium]